MHPHPEAAFAGSGPGQVEEPVRLEAFERYLPPVAGEAILQYVVLLRAAAGGGIARVVQRPDPFRGITGFGEIS